MEKDEIDLKELLKVFWDKKDFIFIITLISIICGFIYTMYIVKPKYTAKTTLIMAQQNVTDSSKAVTATDVTLNDKLIGTYQELAKSASTVREVISNLNLQGISENELKKEIAVTTVKETQMLQVSVTDLDPELATKVANELGIVFSKKVEEIYKIDNVNIVDKAEVPEKPSNINHAKDLIMFAIGGFVLAVVIIFLINLLDTTVKSASDIESSIDLLVLAEIPECDFSDKRK